MDDLLDSFEDLRKQQEPGPSLMAQMEKRKQNEARNFTKGLLASMAAGDGAGSSSGGKTKRRSDGTASEEQSTSTSSKRTKQGLSFLNQIKNDNKISGVIIPFTPIDRFRVVNSHFASREVRIEKNRCELADAKLP